TNPHPNRTILSSVQGAAPATAWLLLRIRLMRNCVPRSAVKIPLCSACAFCADRAGDRRCVVVAWRAGVLAAAPVRRRRQALLRVLRTVSRRAGSAGRGNQGFGRTDRRRPGPAVPLY